MKNCIKNRDKKKTEKTKIYETTTTYLSLKKEDRL